MRQDLRDIRNRLDEIAEKEATYLFRLAWRMTAHGCNPEHIQKVREEASALHMMGHPEWLLDYFKDAKWEYAFKI